MATVYWLCILYLYFRVKCGKLLKQTPTIDRVIIWIMRFTFASGLVCGIILIPIYWLFVYDGDKTILFYSINYHGVTAFIIFVEWFMNSLQMKYKCIICISI